ncbi:MAG TPA: non-ribosomal peptide synthetase [Rudaea sp.]|nr:non-ribosomal peptide synthetase [Rudaea sp.]
MNSAADNLLLAPILAQAALAPREIAVQASGDSLSYAGLLAAAACFAESLRRADVGPGDLVAIGAERSPETIALILAIVARGAAYLPLDATQGEERIAAMLEDAPPKFAIADDALRRRLPPNVPQRDRAALVSLRADLPLERSGPLAYVLFTSGSTGRPKGVAMRTAAVARLLDWHRRHPRLGNPARTLQFAPLGFDVSFQEIFSTLATGGTLILPSEIERRDPWALAALIGRERVERAFLPCVALHALANGVEAGRRRFPLGLTDVIVAGERLRITPQVRAFFAALGVGTLHNHYGPTETHVVTAHELDGDSSTWPELPPIGQPLPHVRARIAMHGAPATDADEGELLLGGQCLAAGYIGQPELTAERFVDIAGERWYRTGDRVRRNANAELEYLGRFDDQLKIAGHRVEPAEIEAVLGRHAEIAQVAVVGEERASGMRLVAHVAARAGADAAELERALTRLCERTFPEPLRPQAYVFHALLPTTPNGKIDRRGLASAHADAALEWPEGAPLDIQLRELWRQLLGLARVDAHANLFELGARSLTVVQALAELRRHGHVVSVAQIYEHPTVAAQAALLDAAAERDVVHIGIDQLRGAQQRAALARFARPAAP